MRGRWSHQSEAASVREVLRTQPFHVLIDVTCERDHSWLFGRSMIHPNNGMVHICRSLDSSPVAGTVVAHDGTVASHFKIDIDIASAPRADSYPRYLLTAIARHLNHWLANGSTTGRHSPGKVIDRDSINIVAMLVPTGPDLIWPIAKAEKLCPSPGNPHLRPQIPAIMISEYDQAVIQDELHFVLAEGIIGGPVLEVIPEGRFVAYQQRDSALHNVPQHIETRHPCDQTTINVSLRIAGNYAVNRFFPINPVRAGEKMLKYLCWFHTSPLSNKTATGRQSDKKMGIFPF
jgi:hypothetical protein